MGREIDIEEFKANRRDLERWEDEERNGVAVSGRDGNPLADLLVYLSDGYHTGTLLARSLAFLWVLRPDLLAVDKQGGRADQVAAKFGLPLRQFYDAVRGLRETAPDLDQVMRDVRTSRARFLALAEIKSRRRALAVRDAEAMAEARRELAPIRVKKRRKSAREWDRRKRLRVARQVLALADPLMKAAAEEMRAFDRSMGLRHEERTA